MKNMTSEPTDRVDQFKAEIAEMKQRLEKLEALVTKGAAR